MYGMTHPYWPLFDLEVRTPRLTMRAITDELAVEQQFYLASVLQACADAGLSRADMRSEKVGLYDGTSRGNFAFWYDAISAAATDPEAKFRLKELMLGMPGQAVGLTAAALGVQGPTFTFNGTCAAKAAISATKGAIFSDSL